MVPKRLSSLKRVADALPFRGAEDNDEDSLTTDRDGPWVEAITHWTDSYVAHPVRKVRHPDGALLWLWSGVEEGGRGYTVTEDDEYAVELLDARGELITGESFETRDAANCGLEDLKTQYVQAKYEGDATDDIEIQGEER